MTLAARRGRAPAPGAALRPAGRPPLRHDLGLDQGDARLGPRRLAVLPGGDAGGRRGSPLHRPADGHPGLGGHRQCRSRRRSSWPPRPPPRSSTWGCRSASSRSPRPPIYLSLAPKSDAAKRAVFAARAAHPRARRRAAAGAPALLHPQRPRLRQPAPPAGTHLAPGADARPRPSAPASTRPTRPRRCCATAWSRSAGPAAWGRSRVRLAANPLGPLRPPRGPPTARKPRISKIPTRFAG